MGPEALAQVLRPLQERFLPADFPDLLVGLGRADDAAVYRLSDDRALIVTTDFFTPVVDDAYDYGAIAAANSMSDVYAMGGEVVLALNVAGFPDKLPTHVAAEILRGGADKVAEAGAVIAGGHTMRATEPMYGLVAVGLAHPDRLMVKGGARPGDRLVLTKPLGLGVITTALKAGKAKAEHVAAAVESMKRLNRAAARCAVAVGVRGATDITGFSLLGHALEMAEQGGVRLRFAWEAMPFLPGALEAAAEWIFPGGASDNAMFYESRVAFAPELGEEQRMLLFDPQTSGGLLLAVPAGRLAEFAAQMEAQGQPFWVVGDVGEGEGVVVTLCPDDDLC
jgi:selenide,water dikinase